MNKGGKISTNKTAQGQPQAESQSYRSGAVPKKKKERYKKRPGTKARVFLSATFRPSNISLPVLGTSNYINIKSTTVERTGEGVSEGGE